MAAFGETCMCGADPSVSGAGVAFSTRTMPDSLPSPGRYGYGGGEVARPAPDLSRVALPPRGRIKAAAISQMAARFTVLGRMSPHSSTVGNPKS